MDSEQRRLVVSGFWRRVQAKESMLAQKLQVRWIREGDANSSYFCVSLRERSRRYSLVGLQVGGA